MAMKPVVGQTTSSSNPRAEDSHTRFYAITVIDDLCQSVPVRLRCDQQEQYVGRKAKGSWDD